MNLSKYVRKRERLERIRVIAPATVGQAVLKELHDRGWHVNRLGPYTTRAMYPAVDPTRNLFIAERIIER